MVLCFQQESWSALACSKRLWLLRLAAKLRHTTGAALCRQEDAQEFLSYLLDRMHEELLNSARLGAEGHAQSSSADFANVNGTPAHAPEESMDAEGEDGEDDGWETVGKKNKTAVTRLHAVEESDVSSIFFGQLRSEIKTQGGVLQRGRP